MSTYAREPISNLSIIKANVPFVRRMKQGLKGPFFVAFVSILVVAFSALGLPVVRATTPYGWAPVISDVSPVRSGPAVAQDGTVSPSQVLLFGGKASSGLVNDTWRFNGTTWAQLSPSTSPTVRSGASLVYDPVRNQVVLFGGATSSNVLNDTWVWNGSTWTSLSPAAKPAARSGAAAVWDSVRNVVVLFGGANKSNKKLDDTWTWNGTNWTQLSPATKPAIRSGAAAAFDTVSGSMILFGGAGSNGALADTWRWNGTTWTQLSMTTSPSARSGAGAAFDPITNEIVLFGGLGSSENNDSWKFGSTTWAQLTPAQAPTGRDSFGFAPGGNGSLVLVDGKNGNTAVGGTWVWQTVPGAPQSVTAAGQNRQATVSWSAPLGGGSPITSYTVTASPGGVTATSTSTSATVTGLQVATAYTFTVTATNSLGTSAASSASNTATTWDYPSTPQSVAATAGNAQATVSWQAPASDGGGPITGYTVTPYIGATAQPATNVSGSTLSKVITGLTNGTAYTFAVTAATVVGAGPAGTSSAVTPITVPTAPQGVAAVPGDTQATVSWQAPSSDGGSAITGYAVTTFIGSTQQSTTTVDAATFSLIITGLTNETAYTFTVAATNAAGSSPASSATTTPSNRPSEPLNVSAIVNGYDSADVSWQTPLYDGGSPIISYTVTPYRGSTALTPVTATSSPATITGLTGSTTLTFTVAATNASGTGAAAASSPVTTAMTPCPVAGATNIWTGAAGTTTWTTAGNWSAGHQPNSTEIVCLPAGTLGGTSISVPSATVKQFLSYKPITIASGFTTIDGADFEANTTWTGGTFTGPSINIGSDATITVNGQITLAGSIAITNAGTVSIVNGLSQGSPKPGIAQSCGAGNTASWVNTGTLVFADTNAGSLVNFCGGTFTNAASGTVTRSVGGTDYLNAGQLVNNGLIATPTGSLSLYSAAGLFSGGSVVGAPGKIILLGVFTATDSATIGDNVWVRSNSSTLTGTIVIPAGATVHVGYDSSNAGGPNIGTISGRVTGAGTLSVVGYPLGSGGNLLPTATVAADLDVDNVTMSDYATIAAKPDGTPIQIGSNTNVTIAGRVTMAGSVEVVNNGTINVTVGAHYFWGDYLVGGLASTCNGTTGPSLTNNGTLSLSDTTSGASVVACTFINSGIVRRTTGGQDYLSTVQSTNTGQIIAQAGSLIWFSTDGQVNGGSIGGGPGQVILTGSTGSTFTATADATFGDNVWVVSNSYAAGGTTLTGTIVIPAGATLHVGYNPSYEQGSTSAGTISGTVTGAGTLSVLGHFYSSIYGPGTTSTATVAADLDIANVTLGDYTALATKPDGTATQIGSGTSVDVAGAVKLTGSVAVVNNGAVNLTLGYHQLNGVSLYGGISTTTTCGAPEVPSWLNEGALNFVNANGYPSFGTCEFTNTANGTVNRPGSGQNMLSASQFNNAGLIAPSAGGLIIYSTSGSLTAGTLGGGGGQVILTGPSGSTFTATADATFGDNVWVASNTYASPDGTTLTGTIVIPAGATLHVGYNPSYEQGGSTSAGTISGTVTGAGTLSVIGHYYPSIYGYPTTSIATVAGDLNVAHVTTDEYTTFAAKSDSSPTQIGSDAVVTLLKKPTLESGLTLENYGTIDFGSAVGYFNCSTCTVINRPSGSFVLNNPDGSFRSFGITAGTLNNEGVMKFTGYMPGTAVWFGPDAQFVGAGKGKGMTVGLVHPTWIQNLQSGFSVPTIVSKFNQQYSMGNLVAKGVAFIVAHFTNAAIGACADVNGAISVVGGSLGLCLMVDPAGREAIAVTVAGGGTVDWVPSGSWLMNNLLGGANFTVSAGVQALWRYDSQNDKQPPNAFTDLDGLAICENGTTSFLGGVTGQHCWSPADQTPFDLGVFPLTLEGIHSGYFGIAAGGGASAGVVTSYTVTFSCSQWYELGQQYCPVANIALPEISGTPAVGQQLTTSNGSWTMSQPGDPPITYSYQWKRCTTESASSCSSISGATNSSYTVTTTDKTRWISVAVIATNPGGSQSATATPVGQVP